ncbi:2-oxoglutarate dehydrogenase E1 component, partial [Ceratobasidium sp. 370]
IRPVACGARVSPTFESSTSKTAGRRRAPALCRPRASSALVLIVVKILVGSAEKPKTKKLGSGSASKEYKPSPKEWLSSSWDGFPNPKELAEQNLPHNPTGVEESVHKRIGQAISTMPQGFTAHRNLVRILAARGKSVEEGTGIDWATAEALAFGSHVLEKNHVRISGQDVERGTFSQRHAVIHDQENEQQYNSLGSDQAAFSVCNSSLSEFGALGFELGYSLVSPSNLTMWEAQFGDFANNAQCIIDQFIAAGERKWVQRSGIVMSLPHGYDGQGPEHSSGRIERYLQ